MILDGALLNKGLPKDNLAAKGCPEFVVEFNSYSITGEESNFANLSLAGSGPMFTAAAAAVSRVAVPASAADTVVNRGHKYLRGHKEVICVP